MITTRLGVVKTKTLARLIESDSRLVGVSIEDDGVFLYTESTEWCDDSGSGTFRGDTETAAKYAFLGRVMRSNGDREYPQPLRAGVQRRL